MGKYWFVPASAFALITVFYVYSFATIQKPPTGQATFIDGTHISHVEFHDVEGNQKQVLIKGTRGSEEELVFAIHLNDQDKNIIYNAGDFPLNEYCTGQTIMECAIPIDPEAFTHADYLGVAAYKVPGHLLQVSEGLSDWSDHRAIFSTGGHDLRK